MQREAEGRVQEAAEAVEEQYEPRLSERWR